MAAMGAGSMSVAEALARARGNSSTGGSNISSSVLRLRLCGQVCRKRDLPHLVFLTLRQATSCDTWDAAENAPRIQAFAKLQNLGAQQMDEVKQLTKLGDMLQLEGPVDSDGELQVYSCKVMERWAVSCQGRGFIPDIIESPNWRDQQRGQDCSLCKFWINSGSCRRGNSCRFRHSMADSDTRPWSNQLRAEWQRANREKKQAARRATRRLQMVSAPSARDGSGDNNELWALPAAAAAAAAASHGGRSREDKHARASVFAAWLIEEFGIAALNEGGGVVDVAGGRGELSLELALSRGVQCTLLEPRHPAKISKAYRKLVAAAVAAVRLT